MFSQLNAGIFIALLACGVVTLINAATVRGVEWKILGVNPRFAYYGGINVSRNALAVFLVSGGIAGLAGAEQVLGVDKACHDNFSPPLRLRRHRGRHAREEQPYWRHLRGLSLRDDECGKRGVADDDGREQVSRPGAALHHCSRAGRAVLFLMACALALAGERRVSVREASWTPT